MFFCNSLAFLMTQQMLVIWSLVPMPFLKPAWTSGHSQFTYCWSLAWRILSITLLVWEMNYLMNYSGVIKYPFNFNMWYGVCTYVHAQWCLTLCDSMDCILPGSSVHGVFQARILLRVAISCSRGSSWPRDWT